MTNKIKHPRKRIVVLEFKKKKKHMYIVRAQSLLYQTIKAKLVLV